VLQRQRECCRLSQGVAQLPLPSIRLHAGARMEKDVSALPQAIFVRAQLAKVQCFSLLAQARLRIRHALAHTLAPGVVGLGFSGGCVFCEMPNGVEQVTGLKACFAIPLTRQGHVVSVVVFYSRWGALARLRHDRAVWMPGGVAAGM